MSSVIFSNAQRIISQIFNWLQLSSQGKTSNLITDTFSPGINNATSLGEGFLVVPGSNNTSSTPSINVTLGGIAYDAAGNRVFISPSDTLLYNSSNILATTNDGLGNFLSTPQSTGVVNVPITQFSQNYLWINYLATIDTTAFTLNKETNAKIFYKQTDGYSIQVTTVNIPPNSNSIYLASINMIGGGAVAPSNISQVGRSYYQVLPNIVPIITPLANLSDRTPSYNPASTYTLEAHIKAVGTGTGISPFNPHNMSLGDLGVSSLDLVQAHRQLEHGTNGSGTDVNNTIVAGTTGSPYPTTSAMACEVATVSPGSDHIIVRQLLSSEAALINGSGFSNTQIFGVVPTDATVVFPNASGTYSVYWDSITKSFAVTTADISTDPTKIWLCTVIYTFVGTGPTDHNTLTPNPPIDRRRIGSSTEKYQRWVTTARPNNPLPGEYGFNMDINAPEYFDGIAWQSLGTLTGAIVDFAGASLPAGYLPCDGSAVSRSTYANLFNVIGVFWGPGDGSTTFNVPSLSRRTTVGSGGVGTGTLGNTVGNVGGEETHTLSVPEIPANLTVTDPGHYHDTAQNSTNGGNYNVINANAGTTQVSSFHSFANTTGISVGGGGGAHNNIQPSAIVTKIIKY